MIGRLFGHTWARAAQLVRMALSPSPQQIEFMERLTAVDAHPQHRPQNGTRKSAQRGRRRKRQERRARARARK